jgi:hypothetical protein
MFRPRYCVAALEPPPPVRLLRCVRWDPQQQHRSPQNGLKNVRI